MENSGVMSASRIHRRLIQVGGCILLLLSFLSAFLFLYFQFRTASLQSIAAANESFSNYVDSVLRLSNTNIRTSAMQMFYTSSIRNLRTSDDLSWSERTIGHRDLGNFASSSNFIDHVMVYNGNLDIVFTSESSYGSAPSGEFHDREAVDILLHPENHSYLTPFKRVSGSNTYYSFLFSEEGSRNRSAMLLDINAGWYESQLLGTLSRDRHMIVDADGLAIIPSEGAETPPLPDWKIFQSAFAQDPQNGYVLPDSSPFLSSCWVYHQLAYTGWYYLELFQLEVTAPGLVHIQTVVFVLFALLSGALLILFVYLFVFILPPFLHISRALTTVELDGKDSTEKFDELLSSHKALETSRRLQELQTGSFPQGIRLPIVMVSADDAPESLYTLLSSHPGTMEAQLELGVTFVLPACTNKGRNRLLSAIRGAELSGPVFVSLPCYSKEQLLAAFSSLEELKKLAFLHENQTVLTQELLSECNAASGFRPETVSAMEGALKKGQLQAARAQWLLLLNGISRDRYNDFYFAIRYVDKMLTGLYLKYELEAAPPIGRIESLAALQESIDARLVRITEAVEASQQRQADSLCSAVWGKVYELYQDEDCCSQMIAAQLELSQSYLNRQFRTATGMSVNDAVQHVRIDKACKLLRDTSLTVEQIAKQVGHRNIKYFFVLFKKYTGKTPSQFRSELSGAGEG